MPAQATVTTHAGVYRNLWVQCSTCVFNARVDERRRVAYEVYTTIGFTLEQLIDDAIGKLEPLGGFLRQANEPRHGQPIDVVSLL
jgi:hypothetical protein